MTSVDDWLGCDIECRDERVFAKATIDRRERCLLGPARACPDR